MRLLIISHSAYTPPWDEGVKNLVRYIKEFLDLHQIETHVLSLRRPENKQSRIPFGSRVHIAYRLYKQSRSFRPDAILLITACSSWLGVKSSLVKVVSGNGPLILYVTSVTRHLKGYRLLLRTERVMVISPFLQRYFPGAPLIYPVSPLQSLVQEPGGKVRKHDDPLRVLFLGAWEPGRGIEILVEAVGKVSNRVPILLTIALNSYATLSQNELLKIIESNNVQNQVEIKGEVDLITAYNECDVVVIPRTTTKRMSFPVRIIEALAMNKPLIVTTICDMGDLIRGAGIAVPSGDSVAMADALYRMYHDHEFYLSCVKHTKLLSKKYDSIATLHRLLEEIEHVIG